MSGVVSGGGPAGNRKRSGPVGSVHVGSRRGGDSADDAAAGRGCEVRLRLRRVSSCASGFLPFCRSFARTLRRRRPAGCAAASVPVFQVQIFAGARLVPAAGRVVCDAQPGQAHLCPDACLHRYGRRARVRACMAHGGSRLHAGCDVCHAVRQLHERAHPPVEPGAGEVSAPDAQLRSPGTALAGAE